MMETPVNTYGQELRIMAVVSRLLYKNYLLLQKANLSPISYQAAYLKLQQLTLELQHLYHSPIKYLLLEGLKGEAEDLRKMLMAETETDKMPLQHILILPFHSWKEDTDIELPLVRK